MAKPIMIQGTMSNVGKSLITAGLCRIFAQDGYSVAPFKSQNMALNSYITPDGSEIGRAQAMQAEAAFKEADVRMNPILLKPTDDQTSQVIVNGTVLKNMSASEYHNYKKQLMPEIFSAYFSLAEENDIIVIEGAGSPAEINLLENDIVNIGMAKIASSPILLVGDIDRGGVFASLYGTFALLEKDINLFKGFIINKFRGDRKLLEPGLEQFKLFYDINNVGIIPMIDIDIDDEDSLSSKLNSIQKIAAIDIAVIRLNHISNFTDIDSFSGIENLSVRYVSTVAELNSPDLIIIPGSKNTIGDLLKIRANGLEDAIKKQALKGTAIFGICGGYQILSKKISDPLSVEYGGDVLGMGLLDIETVFLKEKTTTRVKGEFKNIGGIFSTLAGYSFEGYEIHLGETENHGKAISTIVDNSGAKKDDGAFKGNIYGSYVHGIFDSKEVLSAILAPLFDAKNITLNLSQIKDRRAHKQSEYDKLAEILRQSLDMKRIYRIIEKGVQNG